jgi:hypothetical protein
MLPLFGIAATRIGLTLPYLRLLNRDLAEHKLNKVAPEMLRSHHQWLIRSNVAVENWKDLRIALGEYTKKYGSDSFQLHYTGVLAMQAPALKLGAPSEFFRIAYKKSNSLDSLSALAEAQVNAKQYQSVQVLLNQLETQSRKNADAAFWHRIIKMEYLVQTKRYQDALTLGRATVSSPQVDSFRIYESYVKALRGVGRMNEANQLDMKLDDIKAKTGYLATREGYSSPVGPWALMVR